MVATRKVHLAMAMTLPLARSIVGSDLGRPSKMPGTSWGISARDCSRGAELATQPGTVCGICYARRGHYTCGSVVAAHSRRLEGLDHPRWVAAMAYLIRVHGENWFRWFDSGDLQSVGHLAKICDVARRTRRCQHWLPTHEHEHVREYLADGGIVPPNLCIRISADHVEDRPTNPPVGARIATSTVHKFKGEPVPAASGRRKHSLECRSYLNENRCGQCRACWDPRVKNVSYPIKWSS